MIFDKKNLPINFYVYAYLREDRTPYYIGKGKGKRAYIKHGYLPVPKDINNIKIIAHKLSQREAFLLEAKLIAKYGRKDLGTGILRNQTDGGDGASGNIHSEESLKKMRAQAKKRENKKKQEGWKYPESARKAISEMQKGVPKPKEWVDNVAAALNNRSKEEKADWKAKISVANKGKKRSEEDNLAKSLRQKGVIRPKTECCGRLWDPGNLAKHKRSNICQNK
jgi:hypothetical protein